MATQFTTEQKIEFLQLRLENKLTMLEDKFSFIIDQVVMEVAGGDKEKAKAMADNINKMLNSSFELKADPLKIKYNFA